MPELPTILCASDLSEASQTAFRFATALARDYGAKVVVLYVYPPPLNHAEAVDRARDPNFEAHLIETLRAQTPEHWGTVVEFRVVEGTPAEEIVKAARDCNLVVIGTHGRSGLRRVLMGSVAEEVLRKAPCPVLTVRAGLAPPPASPPAATTTTITSGNELGVGD
ncbi:MAG: universal stress protein [Gemmataceae bacterium]|nr:universal stress protein [Gemmata sp.]MDW8196843.1 universal stress protein [Gemmataceae bacterium]